MNQALQQSSPISLYRLQFRPEFPFSAACELASYFRQLGISHLYSSPVFQARPGSSHGYDISDFNSVNRELGGEEALRSLSYALHRSGMGLVLDVVPNHMAVGTDNPYWQEVLRFGHRSSHARWFDIDWSSPTRGKPSRLVLPMLGTTVRQALRNGDLFLEFDQGRFFIKYYENRFPLSPFSLPYLLKLGAGSTGNSAQPPPDAELEEALAELRRLALQEAGELPVSELLDQACSLEARVVNRCRGESSEAAAVCRRALAAVHRPDEDFRAFRRLLRRQEYRLAYWGRIRFENSYRRFFDISELIGVRTEDPTVLAETHALVRRLVHEGAIDGLRIDHIDGLLEPHDYLQRLQSEVIAQPERRFPVYVEKILAADERLPEWPIAGTSGYDFLLAAEQLFVDEAGFQQIVEDYRSFAVPFQDLRSAVYQGKRRVLEKSLAPDVARLARRLQQLAVGEENYNELSVSQLRGALIETIINIGIYRSYISRVRHEFPEEARQIFKQAAERAAASSRADAGAVAFLQFVLLAPWDIPDGDPLRESCIDFITRFQQLCAPATAKGVEDTALYTFVPLASLNEVGCEPHFPQSGAAAQFHAYCAHQAERWPGGMLTLSTHDTKRSADVRARLHVLSELPERWRSAHTRWSKMTRIHRRQRGKRMYPDWNTQYFLFQNLVGAWPDPPAEPDSNFLGRMKEFILKSVREAKLLTSWVKQSDSYESAVIEYVEEILTPDIAPEFTADLAGFVGDIRIAGYTNSLAARTLQCAAPGVPDIYQGDELWNFSLVDPDNRREVDFTARQELLLRLQTGLENSSAGRGELLDEMLSLPESGLCKLYTIYTFLQFRREFPALFLDGSYVPLETEGTRSTNLIAFLRRTANAALLIAVPRRPFTLAGPKAFPLGEAVWGNTAVVLPADLCGAAASSLFSAEELRVSDGGSLAAAALFDRWPTAAAVFT